MFVYERMNVSPKLKIGYYISGSASGIFCKFGTRMTNKNKLIVFIHFTSSHNQCVFYEPEYLYPVNQYYEERNIVTIFYLIT